MSNEVWCVEKKFGENWKPIIAKPARESAEDMMHQWDSYPSSYSYRITRYIPEAKEAA